MVNHISMSELNLQRFKNQLRNKISKGNVSKKEFSSLLMVSVDIVLTFLTVLFLTFTSLYFILLI